MQCDMNLNSSLLPPTPEYAEPRASDAAIGLHYLAVGSMAAMELKLQAAHINMI